MVGGLQNHDIRSDILEAKAIGLDGFALNFGKWFLLLNVYSIPS
jgi:hypothetical protein